MLYSRLSGSSTGVLFREIPKECSEKFAVFFRKDRTGLIAFILSEVRRAETVPVCVDELVSLKS